MSPGCCDWKTLDESFLVGEKRDGKLKPNIDRLKVRTATPGDGGILGRQAVRSGEIIVEQRISGCERQPVSPCWMTFRLCMADKASRTVTSTVDVLVYMRDQHVSRLNLGCKRLHIFSLVFSLEGRPNFQWQASPNDMVQDSSSAAGIQLESSH